MAQGKLVFASAMTSLSSLSIADGATAAVAAGGSHLLSAGSLSLNNTGILDLADNSLIVRNFPMTAVGLLLRNGYHSGAWNGPGIQSSSSSGNSTMSLGYANAADVGLTAVAGQPITGNVVVVKCTRVGDSSLDGKVDLGNDFNLFLQGFVAANSSSWELGDYNYDEKTDATDFGIFIDGYMAQNNSLGALENAVVSTPLLSTSQKAALLATIPEPAMLTIPLLIGILGFRQRRNGKLNGRYRIRTGGPHGCDPCVLAN